MEWDDDGWVEVWGDLNNTGAMTRLPPRRTGVNLMNGRPSASLGLGFYHQNSLFDGTVAGQPRQEVVYTDYANVQRVEYTGG